MSIPLDKELYQQAKQIADQVYTKPSAFKSGFIVKKYKQLGGRYRSVSPEKPLKRWFEEQWIDIGNGDYPVFRPTKKVNEKTPLTVDEIDQRNLKNQIKLKQQIRGESNLPPFKPRSLRTSPKRQKSPLRRSPRKTIR